MSQCAPRPHRRSASRRASLRAIALLAALSGPSPHQPSHLSFVRLLSGPGLEALSQRAPCPFAIPRRKRAPRCAPSPSWCCCPAPGSPLAHRIPQLRPRPLITPQLHAEPSPAHCRGIFVVAPPGSIICSIACCRPPRRVGGACCPRLQTRVVLACKRMLH